jgi:hypothetical protein
MLLQAPCQREGGDMLLERAGESDNPRLFANQIRETVGEELIGVRTGALEERSMRFGRRTPRQSRARRGKDRTPLRTASTRAPHRSRRTEVYSPREQLLRAAG